MKIKSRLQNSIFNDPVQFVGVCDGGGGQWCESEYMQRNKD